MNFRVLISATMVLSATAAAAETAYVTDVLQLGIHRARDTSDRAFANLISGTALEILESSVNYAHVRTEDGREGWVRAAYLVSDKPAKLRVAEMESELERLQSELETVSTARATAEQEASRLAGELHSDLNSVTALKSRVSTLEQQNADYEIQVDRYRMSLPLKWVAGALLVTLVGGIALGWWWLDTYIRRRHGGYRVY